MKSFGRNLIGLGLLAGFSLVAAAADVDGILIDKACSTKALSGGQTVANGHDHDCLLQESCVRSGYGVYTADGKYLKLDTAGDAKALAAIKASKQKDNYKVRVTGVVDGDSIKVTNLKLL